MLYSNPKPPAIAINRETALGFSGGAIVCVWQMIFVTASIENL
jgi:hypothetical protein